MKDNTQKKKGNSRLSKAQIILGLALLAAGLVVYGLDACQIASIPYSKAIFVCATCLGIFFAASGACDIFLKSTEAMDTEAGDEQNKALADAAMAFGFRTMSVAVSAAIFILAVSGRLEFLSCIILILAFAAGQAAFIFRLTRLHRSI